MSSRTAHPFDVIPDGAPFLFDVIPDGAQRRAGIQTSATAYVPDLETLFGALDAYPETVLAESAAVQFTRRLR